MRVTLSDTIYYPSTRAGLLSCFLSLVLFAFCSCVNSIEEEDTEGERVEISFSSKIGKASTRVTDTAFDIGDEVGLFSVLKGESFAESRLYIDNLFLVSDGSSKLTPKKVVFFPENGEALDFFSYYPYKYDLVMDESGKIPVAVNKDQSTEAQYTASDFLVATKEGVSPTSNAVDLTYTHLFSKLKIKLVPADDETITVNELLKAKPKVVVSGFATTTEYDINTKKISEATTVADITANGQWSISSSALVGKSLIVIPQTVKGQYITLELNGKLVHCEFPESVELKSNYAYEITIPVSDNSSQMVTGIKATVSKWEDGDEGEVSDTDNTFAAVHVSALSFKDSNVYWVYDGATPVAEICKEFLYKEGVYSTQAIVVYPLESEVADLSEGIVLQLLDVEEDINGGTIKWDTTDNTFTYTEGKEAPIDVFYIDGNNNISLTATDDAKEVNVAVNTIRDLRNGTLKEYGVVKIGTQYWMRSDLQATAYSDGTALTKRTDLNSGAGYFKPSQYTIYFYNGEAVLANNLAPDGWKIPATADWDALKNYVGGHTSFLKADQWESATGGEVTEVNNASMLTVYPLGSWANGAHSLPYKMAGYWTLETDGIPENTVAFIGDSDEFKSIPTKTGTGENQYYKALSIRCIKE